MGTRVLRVERVDGVEDEELRRGLEAIRVEQELPDGFSADVQRAAEAAARAPRLPDLDRTDLELVTIDPPGARDLDQAMHLERDGDGYVVHYAIADVMAFLTPGDPVDLEARRRGESLYGADTKVPLHPPVLSEGAASLLPDQVTPAFVWTLALDAAGAVTSAEVVRARVRSRAQLDYAAVQQQLEGADPGSTPGLLRTVGELRLAQEAARGGISLPMPSQELERREDGWHLEFRQMLPVESWNAQVSLMTGFAAAEMMIGARVGVLRTLPPAPEEAVRRLRRTARALGVDWPADLPHPDLIRTLDPARPDHAALVVAATSLLRGAGYAVMDGALPEQTEHAALASPYAHVTAPLRRLVDRFGLEVCAALTAGTAVPDWVREALPQLPELMADSGRRAGAYERSVLDLVEALALEGRVGAEFAGVVLEAEKDGRKGTVMLRDPAVEAPLRAAEGSTLPVGEEVTATLTEADPVTRRVRFSC
ncbi:RNB domain-containing ribonuclease [Nocardioides aurantiacus]|uniref:Exoribonuclease R n=1 Tax=Nocardioides aurantiacus TaxID=86796 RepID=A0A3N2CS48_9ACTN|nr:RNB domain-containing ribonuclease [Nocardioides aurantiacus]ROR90362.1 exoribonuclease R [Nocardioides aurantiacus]